MRILGSVDAQATLVATMDKLTRYLKPVVTAFTFFLMSCAATGVTAQDVQHVEDELKSLMQQLRGADPAVAELLADRVRREWSESGSAAADYLLSRGRKAMELGNTDSALEHFTALIDHAPDFAQGWAERAQVYFLLELYGPAVGDLEHVLALIPDHFDAIMGLAVMLDSIERPEDAYQAYLQVNTIHPHQPGLTEALARLELKLKGQKL